MTWHLIKQRDNFPFNTIMNTPLSYVFTMKMWTIEEIVQFYARLVWKLILNKKIVRVWSGFIWLRIGPLVDSIKSLCTVNSTTSWNVTPYSLVDVTDFVEEHTARLFLRPESGGSTFLRNVDKLPLDYMAQKIILFTDFTVRTWNLTVLDLKFWER
jgi:hypothetical protein